MKVSTQLLLATALVLFVVPGPRLIHAQQNAYGGSDAYTGTENVNNQDEDTYDTLGSGGSYGPSVGDNSYGSPSAGYNGVEVENSYGQPVNYNFQELQAESTLSPVSVDSANPSQPQTSTPTSTFPTSLMNTFVVDFHFVSGLDLKFSYIAFHFCSGAPNITQCALFNGLGSNAKMIGVELVVTDEVFQTFSSQEKALWHSHEFGVVNGLFLLPELSVEDELTALQSLIGTWGKSTDFYHPGATAPLGVPQLAYAWTEEAQVEPKLVTLMEQILNITSTQAERIEARKGLKRPAKISDVDAYFETGLIGEYDLGFIHVNEEDGEPL